MVFGGDFLGSFFWVPNSPSDLLCEVESKLLEPLEKVPSGKSNIAMDIYIYISIFNRNTHLHSKGPVSIAMLVHRNISVKSTRIVDILSCVPSEQHSKPL